MTTSGARKLSEVVERVTVGHVGPTSEYYVPVGVPFLRTQNVGDKRILTKDLKYVTEEFHRRLGKSMLREGDLVISRVISDRVRCAVVPPELDGANCANIIVVRPGSYVDARYLSHYLTSPQGQRALLGRQVGSAQTVVNTKVIQDWEVPLPPVPEQRRIADLLDKADAVRRKRKEAIALTEELLRSAFLEMFGDPVTNPKGWPVRTIGAVADVQGGVQVSHARATAPIEVPYLRVANVYRDSFSLNEVKLLRVTEAELERTRLAFDDVLVVEGHGNIEEVGRAAVWAGQIENCVHQNHLIRVRCGASILPAFLSSFLNSEGGRRQMRVFGKTTSGLNTISTNNVRNTKLLLPPIARQRQYAALVERHKGVLARMREHELECSSLFNVLVQRAFRGELTRGGISSRTAQLEMFAETGAE